MIYYETELRFRKEFYDYLQGMDHLAKKTIRQYLGDSFNTLESDKGIDFWEMLGDKKLSIELIKTVEQHWTDWTDFHARHIGTNNHTNIVLGIRRINDFINSKPDWLKTIRNESDEVNNYIYKKCKDTFNNGYDENKISPLVEELKLKIGNHQEELFEIRILNYLYIAGIFISPDIGYNYRIMTDIMQTTLVNMQQDKLFDAITRVKENIIEMEYNHFYKYDYRRIWLGDLAKRNNIDVDLSNNIFNNSIRVFEDYTNDVFWTLTEKINHPQLNEIITYKNNNEKLNRRISHIPVGLHLVTIENIKTNKEHDYHLTFKKGLKITGVYEVIENPQNGKELKLKLVDARNRIWYYDTYPHNFSYMNTRQWKPKALSDFVLQNKKQDIELYAERFGVNPIIKSEVGQQTDNKNYTDELFMDQNEINILKDLILKKKNIILQGAPGVGKTFSAKRLAYSLIGEEDESRIKQIQFHQSYSYEDLIMGYRPTEDGFELKTGPFYDFCKLAENDLDNEYFFIIDEINRGNISKIFGELLMLIEHDKRGQEHSIGLLYSDEQFHVPNNVCIIGMMNTADRSLAMIDYAFRRRFAFYELKPAFENSKFKEMLKVTESSKLNELVDVLKKLNKDIEVDDSLGKGFLIGHSYVTKGPKLEDSTVTSIINYEIIPLIEEYWFDDETQVTKWKQILLGVISG